MSLSLRTGVVFINNFFDKDVFAANCSIMLQDRKKNAKLIARKFYETFLICVSSNISIVGPKLKAFRISKHFFVATDPSKCKINMICSGKSAIIGAQAVEVFSIRIRSHSCNEMCGIFGTIYVKDDIPEDDTLYLYDRGSTDLDYIYPSGTSLPLSSTARPIVDTKQLLFVFDLKNADGDEFMKGSYPLDSDTDSYDRCLSIVCEGSLGLATICYSILSTAVTANISIAWVKAGKEIEIMEEDNRGLGGPKPGKETKVKETKVEEPESEFRYYGSIFAYYKKNFKYPFEKDQKQHCRILLLNITKDHDVLRNGGEIPLSRSRVTVPAFSSLVVKACDSASVFFISRESEAHCN